VRRLLDRFADHPALAAALDREYRLLAVAAGLATMATPHDQAAAAGLRLLKSWRVQDNPARANEVIPQIPRQRRSWWRRRSAAVA